MLKTRSLLVLSGLALLAACEASAPTAAPVPDQKAPPRDQISLGNGENYRINTDGMTRTGDTLVVPGATVAENVFIVVHPFKDGAPDGDTYIGHTYLPAGTHTDIPINLDDGSSSGDMMLIMLHRDVNEDQVLDFVFVDENNVEDRAVFEGTTMVAHIFASP